jgi:hypothetical protein
LHIRAAHPPQIIIFQFKVGSKRQNMIG